MKWRCLKTDPPKKEEIKNEEKVVLLFPCISDVSILYITSNFEYATQTALKRGYTHWAHIEPHPQEKEIREYIESWEQ